MLQRLGKPGGSITEEALQRTFVQQITQVRTLLNHCRSLGVLDFIDVKYHDALKTPGTVAGQLAEFLGGDFDAQAVVPSLRRENMERTDLAT